LRLDDRRCHELLEQSDHGVLATRHPWRGVDAVPACFAVVGSRLAVPVDRVKPKESTDLTRTRNLDADPRAVLLCDRWDRVDWSKLWWVRAWLERVTADRQERLSFESRLRERYPPYADQDFAEVLVFEITAVSGWAAAGSGRGVGQ
jgi:hypothetical protein